MISYQDNNVLTKMLDRLFAALANGPSLNCRPHSSRQRVDLVQLARLKDISPAQAIKELLGEHRMVRVTARNSPPSRRGDRKSNAAKPVESSEPMTSQSQGADAVEQVSSLPKGEGQENHAEQITPPVNPAEQAWAEQQSLLSKLRAITEDARTYENDTGVHVLNIGYPLLSLPIAAGGQRGINRRILAPIAFVSVNLTLRAGATPAVILECRNEGVDLITPNTALLSWLEQQSGQPVVENVADGGGENPWDELAAIVAQVAKLLELTPPPLFGDPSDLPHDLDLLMPAPHADQDQAEPQIICSAILGLFPMSNQGLLRDTQAMLSGEELQGPVLSFLKVDANILVAPPPPEEISPSSESLQQPVQALSETGTNLDESGPPMNQAGPPVSTESSSAKPVAAKIPHAFDGERLVSQADPCQARAVRLARTTGGLVVHGPPGTGKSQTITNIIGDHLARGQRVLLVCDKRTALDVVINRLESLGLSQLCAVVHDPKRDQRELYKKIREQLDALPDSNTNANADKQLQKSDAELQKLHKQLSDYHAVLMENHPSGSSFHELVGRWLRIAPADVEFKDSALAGLAWQELESQAQVLGEIFRRAESAVYPKNPWVSAAGISMGDFFAAPMEQIRELMAGCVQAAQDADAVIDPAIPPFSLGIDLKVQGQKRQELLEPMQRLFGSPFAGHWPPATGNYPLAIDAIRQERRKIADVKSLLDIVNSGPLDTELQLAGSSQPTSATLLGQQISDLDRYIEVSGKWYRFLAFGKKKLARAVLAVFGLPLTPETARRVRTFLIGVRARLILEKLRDPQSTGLPTDELLTSHFQFQTLLFDTLIAVADEPALVILQPLIAGAMSNPAEAPRLLDGLAKSQARALSLAAQEQTLDQSRLFNADWLKASLASGRQGIGIAPLVNELSDRLDTLESILRVREAMAGLPLILRGACAQLIQQGVGEETAMGILHKSMLSLEIAQRLRADPSLQGIDGQKLKSAFDRYRMLDRQKKNLVRESILHQWTSKQKDRLLAATGSRLNSLGADLRRRLTIRGQRAMRLRQVVETGQKIDGGDPLFDLRPIWMASPETVAQVFPRKALFDVVIFDEASQMRLEESLPVLTRARRLVVAGDPRQLPPTRFFEVALAASENDEIESDQDLFEAQQGEVEDLLAASLNIEIEQCYLDVHYRSRNPDLIEFSNTYFYNHRLQCIPGHPSLRSRFSPLSLYSANGTYEKRCNITEALQVCWIVRDLLRRAQPPSIGIACFNLAQRDLIVETLDEMAAADAAFGKKLAEARTRRGPASFEGLFVKNLENVQGDERDHIIISTTYGPDPSGRFYKRFGPVGRAGGGRRLNVLVTRARHEVHLVTSIPPSVYRALPPVPSGETPGGAWLLFRYLSYAEELGGHYEVNHQLMAPAKAKSTDDGKEDSFESEGSIDSDETDSDEIETDELESDDAVEVAQPIPSAGISKEGKEEDEVLVSTSAKEDKARSNSLVSPAPEPGSKASPHAPGAAATILPTRFPSLFSQALGQTLASDHNLASEVHWGNDGFCIDLAVHDPQRPNDVTIGILCDLTRFAQADDPVEWELFRTEILQSQGWRLHRIWTPHFFRDQLRCTQAILKDAQPGAAGSPA